MALTLSEKIIYAHLADRKLASNERIAAGDKIALQIDQTLTQDATGTVSYLQFETMGISRVKTEVSVSYIDHNTLQEDFKNPDDHLYLQSVAAKYGLWFSRAGNGICHQVHLERFGVPGKTLLGSDSHTPTGGALGMLAIGAGGLDVAVAMAGISFKFLMPKIIGVRLRGSLKWPCAAKDVILELLKRETVKGGYGCIYEYFGDGASSLSVTERATISNMGAELGATCSIFPSDERTKQFLADRGREAVWMPLSADEGAAYERIIDIDLSALEPMIACPHSPDNVKPLAHIAGLAIDQVVIGSCTNSSIDDLAAAAEIVKDCVVHPRVQAAISCGSRTILLAAEKAGILRTFLKAGFRLLECACGPCIGMGFAPKSSGVSLRTFNRSFKGRSGTLDAGIYLVSPETAAASAIAGCITRAPAKNAQNGSSGTRAFIKDTTQFADDMLIAPLPLELAAKVEVERGPNIKACPVPPEPSDLMELSVLLKTGDNTTTDDIMPAGAKVLPFRSNIPEIAKFVFASVDPAFYQRSLDAKNGFIVGGSNYGQGSSREHAALAPMFLGVRAVIVKSFARIHKANLINYGILPFIFENPADYDGISLGDTLELSGLYAILEASGDDLQTIRVVNKSKGKAYKLILDASSEDRSILRSGGTVRWASK